jgi:large subunit ribosomal protein L5
LAEERATPPEQKKATGKKAEKPAEPKAAKKEVKKDTKPVKEKAEKPVEEETKTGKKEKAEKPAAEKNAKKKVAKKQALKKEKAEPTPTEEEPAKEAETKPEAEEKPEPKMVKPSRKEWAGNPMLKPLIEKVTVNMSVGKSGQPLEQAVTIIKQLTNQKPSKRKAKKTVREFGIRKGESIACVVTLRGEPANEFLRKAFYAIEKKLSKYCFDKQGNFSFGIKEHIDIPGTKYVPQLGIHGMDVSVSLGRAGYRVKRRHKAKSKIGKHHLLTSKEAILFIKDEFDVEIL